MSVNINRKILINTTFNLTLFIINLVLFLIQINNPLTNKWLMIVYFILAVILNSYFLYLLIKTRLYNEKIEKESKKYYLFDWGSFFLFMISIFGLIFSNFLSRGLISGSSMNPTLKDGQSILIYKFNYQPDTNDIIIIVSDDLINDEVDIIIKRVIAVPGDELELLFLEDFDGVLKGKLYINGIEYYNETKHSNDEPTLFTKAEFNNFFINQFDHGFAIPNKVVLAADYYIVLGDNFENSTDSRAEGAFHIHEIGGKMIFIFRREQ